MIYWFTGQPGAGKTVLGTKLHKFLQTEKRNWRKSVFHVDGDHLREIYQNKDYSEQGRRTNIKNAQALVEYLHISDCDVVVSLVAPYLDLREEFKDKIGKSIVEIYVHTTEIRGREDFFVKEYEKPTERYLSINTTNESVEESTKKVLEYAKNSRRG